MNDGIKAKLHLEYDVALGIGDETWHGTEEFDYRDSPGEMRMAMSISLGDTSEENVQSIIGEYTYYYPTSESEELLQHWGRHWKKDGSVSIKRDYVLADKQKCKATVDDPDDKTACKDRKS